MKTIKNEKAARLEEAVLLKSQEPSQELFTQAVWQEADAEKTGYSDYSYWGCTFKMFLKNKSAMFFFIILILLVTFTFVQPLLPNQYTATVIINHPISGKQMSNVPPSLSTIMQTAPKDTQLVLSPWKDDEWYAVGNIVATLTPRTELTIEEYLGNWVRITAGNITGYVINDHTTKLKLPQDPDKTPYASKSNFPLKVHLQPAQYAHNGLELFVRKEFCKLNDDQKTVTTLKNCDLRLLPSNAPLLFGTNNTGQDLWALVWSGARTSLFIGFIVALIEALVGIVIGVLWGYVRRLERVITEIYNIIDNIPNTIILILIAYILRPGIPTLIFAMSLTSWVGMARFIRNQIVIIRDRDYNLASRCLGSGTLRIVMRNLLPYLISVIMLRISLAIPGAIASEVFITYIGLGLPVSIPSLGNLITVGRKLISTSQSYQLIFPTVVLSIVTISFYIIGNAFADAADPRNHV